jgi:DNA polymerase-3 subunit beta
MKFTIDQPDFSALAAWAASALAPRPAVPVAGGIMISAAAGIVTFAGTDYESTCRSSAAADVEGPGTVVVPGKFLAEVAGHLPRQPVTFTVDEDAPEAKLACGPQRWTLPLLPADEFPSMAEMPPTAVTVTAADFAEAVTAVACAASADDTLPTLTAVNVEFDPDGTVWLAATDRYRLHAAWVAGTLDGEPPPSLLLPAKVLRAYARGADQKVTIGVAGEPGAQLAGLADGNRQLVTRTIPGEFVKWRDRFTVPAGAVTVTVDTALTAAAAGHCSVAAAPGTGIILNFDGAGGLDVMAADGGAEGFETVPGAGYDGDPFSLAINPRYFADVLAGCGPRACLTITSPVKPLLVTPAPAAAPGDDGQPSADAPPPGAFTAMVVPIRIPK